MSSTGETEKQSDTKYTNEAEFFKGFFDEYSSAYQFTTAKKPFLRYNEIIALANEPITFQSMFDRTIFHQIMLVEDSVRLHKTVQDKYERWLVKRGTYLGEFSRRAFLEFLKTRAVFEVLNRYICDAFGITGSPRVTTLRFMLKLYRKIRKEQIIEWPKIAEKEIKKWEVDGNVDVKVLRVAAHLVLKFLSFLIKP